MLSREKFIIAIPPPSIRGVGNSGGFKMQLLDRANADMHRILPIAYQLWRRRRSDASENVPA